MATTAASIEPAARAGERLQIDLRVGQLVLAGDRAGTIPSRSRAAPSTRW
jgi:hypothetical protein